LLPRVLSETTTMFSLATSTNRLTEIASWAQLHRILCAVFNMTHMACQEEKIHHIVTIFHKTLLPVTLALKYSKSRHQWCLIRERVQKRKPTNKSPGLRGPGAGLKYSQMRCIYEKSALLCVFETEFG